MAMMGGNLSRWTISYFAVAIAWLLAAEVLMVVGFGAPSADVASPDTLVLVHVVCIGWLSMALCGALFQFVPVLIAKPLFSERWTLPALLLLNAGLMALLAGFLALGGRIPWSVSLLPVGAIVLVAGFAAVSINLGLTLWRARPLPAPARFVAVGVACVCATAAIGTVFALARSGRIAEPLGADALASGVSIHAIAGLGGWLTLTAMGVSYRLLAMFMLAPDADARKIRATLVTGAGTMAIAIAGGVFAVVAEGGIDAVLALAAVAGLMTLGLYGRDVIALFRGRKRRSLELNIRMTVLSLVSLAAVVLLGGLLAATGSFVRHIGAFAFLVAFGWLSGLILAKLYKIVAFLTWLEVYGPVMGRTATPRVQDLVVERRASKWFFIYFLAVWAATAMLLVDATLAFRTAALAMTIATAGIVHELARARRLLDVAGALRLPAGAIAPRLMSSRT